MKSSLKLLPLLALSLGETACLDSEQTSHGRMPKEGIEDAVVMEEVSSIQDNFKKEFQKAFEAKNNCQVPNCAGTCQDCHTQ